MTAKLTHAKGFTLVELIIVIVLLGIVGGGTFAYLGFGAQIFTDVVGREQLSAQSRFAVERLNRELRNSLPASARTFEPVPGIESGGRCIEFIPIRGSGVYLENPQAGRPLPVSRALNLSSSASSPDDVLSEADYEGLYFFIGANTQARIFNPTSENRARIDEGAVSSVDNYYVIDFDPPAGLNRQSPSPRYYLTTTPVAWCVVGAEPPYQLLRFSNYSDFTQSSLPSLALIEAAPFRQRSVMATSLHEGGSAPFTSSGGTLTRNNLVLVDLFFARRDGQEPLVLHHEVHIPNVP